MELQPQFVWVRDTDFLSLLEQRLGLSVSLQCKWLLCETADFLSPPPQPPALPYSPPWVLLLNPICRKTEVVAFARSGRWGVTEDEALKSRIIKRKKVERVETIDWCYVPIRKRGTPETPSSVSSLSSAISFSESKENVLPESLVSILGSLRDTWEAESDL